MFVISILERLRQEDNREYEAYLSYAARLFKNTLLTKETTKQERG